MRIALICAGQGGQYPAMFERLAQVSAAHEVLEQASALAGFDVCKDWPGAGLTDNRLAQILVVSHALAANAALRAEGIEPVLYAGYSVGEMAAHGAAGVWNAAKTLELTVQRAACMDAATAACNSPLGMCAVLGLSEEQARRLGEECGVALAIINGPRHIVVGGPVASLERFEAMAPQHGATHVRRLDVRVASHTPFIAAAAEPFSHLLACESWGVPRGVLLSGLDGRSITQHAESVRLLSQQIHAPLRWHDCLLAMFEYGVDAVIEIGPGRAMTKMIDEGFPGRPVRAFDEFRSVGGVAKWVFRHAG